MSAKQLEYLIDKRKSEEKIRGFVEAHHRMPDGKLIAIMQVCVRCRRTFPPARGRKFCPCCQGLLRNKAIVLKIP